MEKTEAKKKDTFIFRSSWRPFLEVLEPVDVKNLIFMIFDYLEKPNEPKKPNLNDRLLMTWLFIKSQLDQDKSRYDRRCETSKINGQKGGRPKNLKNLNKPKKADNEYDNDYDNDYEYNNSLQEEELLYNYLETNFGRTLSPIEYEEISLWEKNFNDELIKHAVKVAVLNGVCNTKYISRILDSYKMKNITTVQQAQAEDKKFQENKTSNKKFQKVEQKPNWVGQDIAPNEASQEEIEELERRLK